MAELKSWAIQNPALALGGFIILCAVVFFLTRNVIARGLIRLAKRTANQYDDIIVRDLQV